MALSLEVVDVLNAAERRHPGPAECEVSPREEDRIVVKPVMQPPRVSDVMYLERRPVHESVRESPVREMKAPETFEIVANGTLIPELF